MKNISILFYIISSLFLHAPTNAQDASGTYAGKLSFMGSELRIQFHLKLIEDDYTATMDSPDQDAFGLPVEEVRIDYPKIEFSIPMAGIKFEGNFITADSIAGFLFQFGLKLELNFTKQADGGIQKQAKEYNRPQEPKAPFPYLSREVFFENKKDGITLHGTLTLPKGKGPFPGVVLVTGSGPQDRNSEILGHKPFLVLSDHLTRKGIAVLRYDERGVGESTGYFSSATSKDFATDAGLALQFLMAQENVNPKKCGIIGHSEGGIVAPLATIGIPEAAFVVLMAGPGISGAELLPIQKREIELAMGLDTAAVEAEVAFLAKLYQEMNANYNESSEKVSDLIKSKLASHYGEELNAAQVEMMAKSLGSDWMRFFMYHDPAVTLRQIKCPVLAINGSLDLQVPSDINLSAIRNALKQGGNKQVTTKEFPGLNHLFQSASSGLPSEYEQIEETFNTEVMDYLAAWLLKISDITKKMK
jgi:fermentation-respiration switch protein FrsA (DUF1100 family)